MDTSTLLENSNLMVIRAVENLNEAAWDIPGACGSWSVKDIIAHLASYEHIIVDILQTLQEQREQPTPYVLRWINQPAEFNAAEVKARRYQTAQQIEDEYQDRQVQASSLLKELPAEMIHRQGTMPWYKPDCCLADFIALMSQHIQEHCGQIALFRQSEKARPLS